MVKSSLLNIYSLAAYFSIAGTKAYFCIGDFLKRER
jgi:hypothetical protein